MTVLFLGGDSLGVLFSGAFCEYFLITNLIYLCKILFFCYLFIFVRANFPRVRYDQLQLLGWKVFLPLSLSLVYFYSSFILTASIVI
jgi:NADH-quinone oxidoreductase subunit H